jgi:O-antigen/teichoic acid export membrane protein
MRRVALATVIAAVSGYLVLLIAARALGADGYAAFAVFWAAYGLVTGTQNGQLQETTRAVRGARISGADGPRPMPLNVAVGVGLAVVVAVTSIGWAGAVFEWYRIESVVLLAAGVAAFGIYAGLGGMLSGLGRWGPFATLLIVDAVIRLVLTVVAAIAGWGLLAFLVMTIAGTVSSAVVVLCLQPARTALGAGGDVQVRELARNTVTAMAAALASAVLVMGFPVLIKLTTSGDLDSVAGAVILAVTLTRAPLLVPLNSFQGVLISRFVENRDRVLQALTAPLLIVAGVGVVGAIAAWLIGPWLLETVFGADYRLSGSTIAALTIGAMAMAVLTLTGAMALAIGRHRLYAAGWWVATAASIALLFIPADLEARVSIALIAGPLLGMAVHLWAVRSRSADHVSAERDGDRPLPAE